MNSHKIKWLLGITFVWAVLLTFHIDLTATAETKTTTQPGVGFSVDGNKASVTRKSIRAIKYDEGKKEADTNKIISQKVYGVSYDQYAGDYGYSTLTTSGKKVYNAMKTIANSFHQGGKDATKVYYDSTGYGYVTAKVNVSDYNIYVTDLAKIAFAFEADHPIYYWYDGVSYSLTATSKVQYLYITVNPAYAKSSVRGTVQKKINAGLKTYITKINTLKSGGASVFQIELAVHDLLIAKNSYAFDSNGSPENAVWAHNIYGIFGKNSAVCQGYAKAFQMLMNYADIESIYAIGYSSGIGHAWNLVNIGGRWYGVDTTWDDVGDEVASYGGSGVIYNYFNLSTSLFGKGHTYDYNKFSEMYPVPQNSTSDTFWYYKYYKLKLSGTDLASKETLTAAIGAAISKIDTVGQYQMRLAIPVANKKDFNDLYNKYYGEMGESLSSNGKVYTLGKSPVYIKNTSDLGSFAFVFINVSVTEVSGIRENAIFLDTYSYQVSKTDAKGKADVTSSITATIANGKLSLSNGGSVIGSYSVTAKPVVAEPIAEAVYTGKAYKPKPVLTVDRVTLVEGIDYTLEYANNIKAGTAKITVTGIGNYQGKKIINYTITPTTLDGGTIGAIGKKTYTGTNIKPSITVLSPTGSPVDSSDYTITYSNNVNAGTATVTVTGKNNYTGTLVSTFTIAKRNLSSSTVSAIKNQSYTGKAITPGVTIKFNTKKLVKNVDYTLQYSENVNTGKAKIVLTGIGNNFTGSKTVYFKIVPNRVSNMTISSKKRAASIKWNATAGTSGYQIVYAKSGSSSYKSLGTTTKTSFTKKGLQKGKTYYFKVRAYKTIKGVKQYGEYSKKIKIKIN